MNCANGTIDAPVDHCTRCCVALVEGVAYAQPPSPVVEITTDADFTAKLIQCVKCPACGYSEVEPGTHGICSPAKYMSPAVRAHYEVFGGRGLQWSGHEGQYVIDAGFKHSEPNSAITSDQAGLG